VEEQGRVGLRKATLVPVIVVVFLIGSAFGFYFLTTLTSHQTYALAFAQDGACSPPAYEAPWAVALNGHTTIAAPSNASLPVPNTEIRASPNYKNFSVIWFHVPDGVYTYVVSPSDFFPHGTVTVNGADTIVTVNGPFIGCTTSIST
jgi:hypothetical protein